MAPTQKRKEKEKVSLTPRRHPPVAFFVVFGAAYLLRKPEAVVPEHRWRAKVVWVGLLTSIAACERTNAAISDEEAFSRPQSLPIVQALSRHCDLV